MTKLTHTILLATTVLIAVGCTTHRNLCGGYTRPRVLTEEEKELFHKTYHDSPALHPVRVSTQVVAGTNYTFRCRDGRGRRYDVVIYQPLPCNGGGAEVSEVKRR